MRKIIILFSLLLASLPLHSQSNTENYVKSTDCFDADCIKKAVSVQYFDGLGRAKQVVNVKASPQQKDVVTPIIYDGFGRQTRDYLSVPQNSTTSGQIYPQSSNLVPFPVVDVTGVYANEKAYSEKILENSPLDRIRQQIQVGTAWSGKSVQFGYDINTAGEVNRYTTTTSWENGATKSTITKGTYTTDQLYKNTVTDEDGNVSIEFKDGKGQTILVRKMLDATTSADTYYIYNEYSQLAFVIPPMASETLKTMTPGSQVTELSLNDLCYQYRYDGRNRLVEKKLPGKGWEYMVYDKQDRLVLNQDAILRTTGNNFTRKGWIFTKYDQFGRVVYTGFFSNTASRAAIQNAINSMSANAGNNETRSSSPFALNGMEIYYTKNAFPTGSMTVLSVNYYDTYPLGSPSLPSDILGQAVLTQDSQSSDISTKSLPTISYVKNIEDDIWTKNYTWYDTNGRPIGSHSINHLGGYTKIESKLDFLGTPLQTITRHKRLNSDTERVIIENFTYDHQNRLLTHTHQVDNNPVEYLSQNAYNELSQLQSKKVGGTILGSGLQTVDYKYNIRGWMTHINDPQNLGTDLFGYKIKYNQVEGLQTPDASDTALQVVPRFNGNIAEIDWKTSTQENEPLKTYGYVYDNLNRLLAGFYQKSTSPSGREYYEKVTYDLNGNIKSMKRTANQISPTASRVIDNLTYDYYSGNASNRLQKVTDVSQNSSGHPYRADPTDIGYDDNGNMISYNDKGISSIQYNYLNLPKQITQNAKVTNYTYRADGVKVKRIFGTVETDYLDGFQYKFTHAWEDESEVMQNDEMKLRIIPTSEGYYDALLNLYVYNYVDHLGNVRISYADSNHDGNIIGRDERIRVCHDDAFGNSTCVDSFIPGEVVDNNSYYPFGMLLENHNNSAINENAYKYKYNGKELQETGMYDYGARFYMPDIGRWGVVDPLAEMMRRHSPYNYVFNNPINFVDTDGRAPGGPGDQGDGKTIRTQDIEEVVITVRRNTSNFFSRVWNGIKSSFTSQYSPKTNADKYGGLNSYRQWQGNPFYNEGETKMDRIFRLMGNSKNEEMLNFGGGGYNMYGGYGRVSNVSRAAKVTPEVKFSNTPSPITSVYVNNTQVGVIDYSGSAVTMEINLSKDMQGMGIGSKIFNTAVEGETAFEATWVKSDIYGAGGTSKNLIQYNNAIQKGASPTEAAWSTWSGNQAKTNGFNSVNVQPIQNGIKATFTK